MSPTLTLSRMIMERVSSQDFVRNALEELDSERAEAMAASARAIERIEDTRRKYLALSYHPET